MIEENEENNFYPPSNTYAYTTMTPFIMQFDRNVSIDSFWIRLHKSPYAYMERAEGTRTVQILKNSQVISETTFVLTSYEWLFIRPADNKIIGDTIWIDANTDIDGIVVSWGEAVDHYLLALDL